jgi:hypothetical protein
LLYINSGLKVVAPALKSLDGNPINAATSFQTVLSTFLNALAKSEPTS